MAKKQRREAVTSGHNLSHLLALANERITLPRVPMTVDYQDDVDTLCIQFNDHVPASLVKADDEVAKGVVGIYDGTKLIGLEIFNITGQMDSRLAAIKSK